jgi:hypothetical protein
MMSSVSAREIYLRIREGHNAALYSRVEGDRAYFKVNSNVEVAIVSTPASYTGYYYQFEVAGKKYGVVRNCKGRNYDYLWLDCDPSEYDFMKMRLYL